MAMLEDAPFDLLCPGRRPEGLAPVLLPLLTIGLSLALRQVERRMRETQLR